MTRRHLPYRQLLTAGRCVNAPLPSAGTVDAARHNPARRRYPFAHGLLAIALILGAIGYQPISAAAGHRFRPHVECVITHGTPTRPPSRVCRWVRS